VKKPLDLPPRFGSIHRDEVLPLREAARRMGWASRMAADVQRMGLQTVTIGRMKYTTGAAVYQFVEGMMQQGDGQAGQERNNHD
jgi:hypothetical protein